MKTALESATLVKGQFTQMLCDLQPEDLEASVAFIDRIIGNGMQALDHGELWEAFSWALYVHALTESVDDPILLVLVAEVLQYAKLTLIAKIGMTEFAEQLAAVKAKAVCEIASAKAAGKPLWDTGKRFA